MTALQNLLSEYREVAQTEREKGTYFEELIRAYFRHEATYADLYSKVWMYSDWAKEAGVDARDTGIDLVAQTRGTNDLHAIQCKFYDEDYKVQKADIDSFFTAAGQKPFTHGIIVTTTDNWSEHAEAALVNRTTPVTKIDLHTLENSQIDWAEYQPGHAPTLVQKFSPRPHQKTSIDKVKAGLSVADRGKLIMACGTGKTFTSLKIVEELAGEGKHVLFLVPSLALLSQTLTEWTQQSITPLHCFAVCSDSEVGKKRNKSEDIVETLVHELQYPATTSSERLAQEMQARHDSEHMSVVFSTYHSIEVLSEAQKNHALADFDLIICDEAHRTTGATFAGERESHFVKVHDNSFLRGAKRLYMTATPRIYSPEAKGLDDVTLCSMDDPELYGENLHVITFNEAVQLGLLCDYKVVVLAIDEGHISHRLQSLLADENNQLKVDDAAKIIGCYKALSKHGLTEDVSDDTAPMKKAVAFCQVIEANYKGSKHKVSSKQIARMFRKVIEVYQSSEEADAPRLICEAEHVDGSMNAGEKGAKISWLKGKAKENTCRILSNVRCLSEGVDVPALDAVLFLTPRNSQVDVVQSVGRVMRNAPGKQRGYVILPVVIPPGVEPHEALNDNQTYRVVWEVLQALRSHDDRFDAMINKLDLVGKDTKKMEVVAVTDAKPKKKRNGKLGGASTIGEGSTPATVVQPTLSFDVGEIERALYAKVVKKCGNRNYWTEWAADIAKIAQTHITRITTIVCNPKNVEEVKAFEDFADELRDDLNDSIANEEVIEMLAQHLITKPVFDALFEDYSFASNNPVSQAMQQVLEILQEHHLEKERDTLDKFYASVKMRAEGIDSAAGKQKIVVELYDKFFRNAFPRMTERLGIVYTPVEVVDFIIHSINDLLRSEFNQDLGSDGVHIIDPFTGTGTFVTRLMQSGLISLDKLPGKYKEEIHANEIVLLAYYIAAINIEAVYHDLVGGEYQPFEGICLTDTFQMYEKDDLISVMLPDNSERRTRQKGLDIKVIMGNPPYSAGQSSANDNNQNVAYDGLDSRIRSTYAEHSSATNKNALYDSYIRAIRWASDRVGDSGIIGFVTNAGFLEANTGDGLRKCLAEEFSSIYVFHLRGNARTSGEQRRKEKDNVFGQGTRTPIAITLLVKNPSAKESGQIFWRDIGDYLTREEKLKRIEEFRSTAEISEADAWDSIDPDEHYDWINQRDSSFDAFIKIGDKKDLAGCLFRIYSMGIKTNRDSWAYNFSRSELVRNMKNMAAVYNREVDRYMHACKASQRKPFVEEFIHADPTKISWSRDLRNGVQKHEVRKFEENSIRVGCYRPFTMANVYFDRGYVNDVALMHSLFPNADSKNLLICVTGRGSTKDFCAFMASLVPDLEMVSKGQCFPLFIYENQEAPGGDNLFASKSSTSKSRREGISDEGLVHFQKAYPGETISKKDVFYYTYGILHSQMYRERYADNLSKELPRIPRVKTAKDFWAFSKAGRELAELHIHYESVDKYPVTVDTGERISNSLSDGDFRVEKMKFGKGKDKSTVIYNGQITLRNIPLEAYDYVVNGKPALEWVMERQSVRTDKKSGIVNDANLWATETMGNAKYPLELFLRVITVSLGSMKIVRSLPELDLESEE
jgi:predicted helicase